MNVTNPHHNDAPARRNIPKINAHIASKLEEMAEVLQQQHANYFRVQAYRHGTDALLSLPEAVDAVYESKGVKGLIAIPGIGKSIAAAIVELIQSGHWTQLERIRGKFDPIALFCSIPGIGAELAERIVNELHVDSLEGLEIAAYDGRLIGLQGVGRRRLEAIKAILSERLGRRRLARHYQPKLPDIKDILAVDAEYRHKAKLGALKLIAPKRFNPKGRAWLPILHTRRGEWEFTVLFSNTERAHSLNKTDDWVVVYFHSDHHQEGQFTLVTETHGDLGGKRVIRGLESSCRTYYQQQHRQH